MDSCTCRFWPARRSLDEAKSYILTEQFRSAGELDELARLIRDGKTITYGEEELKVAMRIGDWNAAVSIGFLVAAVLLGLLVGGAAGGLSGIAIAIIGVFVAIAFVIAFTWMNYVNKRVARARVTLTGTNSP
jgi:hypothetical protein